MLENFSGWENKNICMKKHECERKHIIIHCYKFPLVLVYIWIFMKKLLFICCKQKSSFIDDLKSFCEKVYPCLILSSRFCRRCLRTNFRSKSEQDDPRCVHAVSVRIVLRAVRLWTEWSIEVSRLSSSSSLDRRGNERIGCRTSIQLLPSQCFSLTLIQVVRK